MSSLLISPEESLLLVVDVQERLWPHVSNCREVRDRCKVLMQGASKLGVPIVISEQYPRGLGRTLPELTAGLSDPLPLCEKISFSCLGDATLAERLRKFDRPTLVVCGIEAHVCVLQTVLEALDHSIRAVVVADAIGSRKDENRQIALNRMRQAGAIVVSTEMILFEWLRTAQHPAFKEISGLLK